jgi:cytochrome c553
MTNFVAVFSRTNSIRLCCLLLGVIGLNSSRLADAADPRAVNFQTELKPLLTKYCMGCHGPKSQKGDLRIDTLDPDFLDGKDADYWHEVLNQLNEGKMPPKGKPQLSKANLKRVTAWLESNLKKVADRRLSTGGRQLMRRMSRYEYQYTLQDLLGIALDYSAKIPGDLAGEDGLKTNANLLGMSMVQMQSYLDVAELALNEAIPNGPEKIIKSKSKSISVTRVRGQRSPKVKKGTKSKFIAPSPGFTKSAFTHDLPRKVTFTKRPFAGRFRIKVELIARASSDGRRPELTIQVGHRASGDYDPKKIMGRRLIKADKTTQFVEFIGNIEDFPLGKKDAYYNGSGSHDVTHLSVWLWNTSTPKSKVKPNTPIEDVDEPLLNIVSVEFEGPLLEGYPSQRAKDLLPALIGANNSTASRDEVAQARIALQHFLKRAFRRDVSDREVERAVESFESFRKLTPDFKSAMRKTMAMILVSPKFIYLVEPSPEHGQARDLNAYELATRLSYFLWASMPDDELLELAATGQLLKPEILKAQIYRMQKDAKFGRFVKHFSDQWLGLSAMENVAVNPASHPSFSDEIRENLKAETLAFASHVFRNDLSCRDFISSDFAVLNQVVAKHYGIDGVHGSEFRPVRLSTDSHRGGVLTHGSLAIIGSDGTDSNPIYRGVWLRKRLFADPPPPPPPGTPPLDKAGSKVVQLTLKEQIKLHREAPACARCHDDIDPWGVAFENYDATGRWRTKIALASKAPTNTRQKRNQKSQATGANVDSTSILPDGKTIHGMTELQEYLIKHRSGKLANAIVRRMLGYALGRQLEFSDNQMVDKLSEQLLKNDLRPSVLIQGIVFSRAFQTK